MLSASFAPVENDTPLVIDPDAPLSAPVSAQLLQPIARRHPQIVDTSCGVDKTEPAQRSGLDIERKPATPLAAPDLFRLAVTETDDHDDLYNA